ncbi:DUF192 domain-containing protein [Stakelama sp. CBK3Z-3]|uniref:DUF192 domain-containing protein n=1 Tax=Stakelama flava TaxID=2860338 RepID=A0ABS6XIT5_9SPHN|nr:DUF192 domain-containing protein [Stakelama flava]MBW4329743.1 DUF192 domain-containing protein [Stakelama flava]
MRIAGSLFVTTGAALLALGGCTGDGNGSSAGGGETTATQSTHVTIHSGSGVHKFDVDIASTPAEQEHGLMFRTDIPENGGMLFTPYPASGGGPREASFWMKNTPSPLDIIFIRPDHTIARIADNTVPFSQTPVSSGEPVSAVLELRGGRTAELGIEEGDAINWDAGAGADG